MNELFTFNYKTKRASIYINPRSGKFRPIIQPKQPPELQIALAVAAKIAPYCTNYTTPADKRVVQALIAADLVAGIMRPEIWYTCPLYSALARAYYHDRTSDFVSPRPPCAPAGYNLSIQTPHWQDSEYTPVYEGASWTNFPPMLQVSAMSDPLNWTIENPVFTVGDGVCAQQTFIWSLPATVTWPIITNDRVKPRIDDRPLWLAGTIKHSVYFDESLYAKPPSLALWHVLSPELFNLSVGSYYNQQFVEIGRTQELGIPWPKFTRFHTPPATPVWRGDEQISRYFTMNARIPPAGSRTMTHAAVTVAPAHTRGKFVCDSLYFGHKLWYEWNLYQFKKSPFSYFP